MNSKSKVALVTGSSQRIGAQIVRSLHKNGMDVAIHYRNSEEQATHLKNELHQVRPSSAVAFSADFNRLDEVEQLAGQVIEHFGRLDALVNNASILEYESNNLNGQRSLSGTGQSPHRRAVLPHKSGVEFVERIQRLRCQYR